MTRWWLLAAVAALAAAAHCTGAWAQSRPPPAQSTREVLAQCVEQADAQLRGLEDLRAVCPGIEAAIHDLDIDAELPARWQDHVSARALSDWGALAHRYHRDLGTGAGTPLPEPSRLQDIARSLPQPGIRLNFWQDIWTALMTWLSHHRDFLTLLRGFLSVWRGAPPLGSVLQGLLVLLLVLVVAVAVVIIYRELRAAGVLERHSGPPLRRPAGTRTLTSQEQALNLEAAPPRLRPVLLLRMLVAALSRAHRLEYERVLTCRELVTSARFDTELQRERFAALTLLAERGLYGDPRRDPPPEQDAVLAAARSLEEQLWAAPSTQGTAG